MRYSIRPFETTADYRACVELQDETWGAGFSERVSPAILKVGQILGGVSAGAFDADGRLVGFVFGLTGVRDGRVVHWSDMLAVRPEARDSGLGRRLKDYQRQFMLDQGVDTMFWTFDPLQSRNAHLNITRLGAVVREYRTNMYGTSDSPLHLGIGTDRFVALWMLDSERVRARLAGEASPVLPDAPWALGPAEASTGSAGVIETQPVPGTVDLMLDEAGNAAVRVAIPTDIGAVMAADMQLAVDWRSATRAAFEHYFSAGYEVAEFERGTPTSNYVLVRIPERDA